MCRSGHYAYQQEDRCSIQQDEQKKEHPKHTKSQA